MVSKEVRAGLRVRVGAQAHYGGGMIGTITRVYGDPHNRAAEVAFETGRTVLYWHFQIEPVELWAAGRVEDTLQSGAERVPGAGRSDRSPAGAPNAASEDYSLRYGLPMAAGATARPPKPTRTRMVRT